MSDLQILTDDQRVHLLRKTDNGRFREVDIAKGLAYISRGNQAAIDTRTLTQIDKTNVSRLAPKWVFSYRERTADREYAGGCGRHHVRLVCK
jgi:hypothetical protein